MNYHLNNCLVGVVILLVVSITFILYSLYNKKKLAIPILSLFPLIICLVFWYSKRKKLDKIKAKHVSEYILNEYYEEEEVILKLNPDFTYKVYNDSIVFENGIWDLTGNSNSSNVLIRGKLLGLKPFR